MRGDKNDGTETMGERKAEFESGTLIGVSMSEPHLVLRMPLLI